MSEITCKAAVAFNAQQKLEIVDVQVAPPKDDEVRIKVLFNGMCATDLHNLSGKDAEAQWPAILGHEGTGIVESVGNHVTHVQPGDHVLCLYTPECMECKFCRSGKTNLCQKIRETQGHGLMPDKTVRFSYNGDKVYHFMGCSTLSQYTVVAGISCVKIDNDLPLDEICLLGCGVTTGYGAVKYSSKVTPQSNVAVFGCGCVGLSAIQSAKSSEAAKIIAIDVSDAKREHALAFGATDFINCSSMSGSELQSKLVEMTDGGVDFAFDCTGNVDVMKTALESCHKGWGELCVVGVAPAGAELKFRPFLVVTGRVIRGSAFGGVKSRSQLPQLIEQYRENKLKVREFITRRFALNEVNEAIEFMNTGNCIRAVIDLA